MYDANNHRNISNTRSLRWGSRNIKETWHFLIWIVLSALNKGCRIWQFGKLLKKEYKYKGKITTIYNSIDINHYNFNKIKEEDCISKFPFLKNINKPIILYAGRLISQKGIDIFIKSIKLLQDKGYNFHYIIAGKGNTNLLYNNLKENKIDKNNINYVGYIDNRNLVYLYRMSDIFTLPSYYENLPISLLEAMSMKSCCISTNVGAVDEVIDNNKNGGVI